MGFPGAKQGCHAEFIALKADGPVAPKPRNLDFTQATSLPFGGTTALDFLRRGRARAGESMLVIGASGAVGSAMAQLARVQGLTVTTVVSAANLALMGELGFAAVDYAQIDIHSAPERYDIIADCVGATSFARAHHLLNENGRFLAVAGGLGDFTARPKGGKRAIAGPAAEKREDLFELARLAEAGLLKPVIDSVFDFSQMREAHRRVDSKRKRGNVVVEIGG